MQYTLRNIPRRVDEVLRSKARSEGKSLNEAALEAIRRGLGLEGEPSRHDDLDWFIGSGGGLEKEVLDAIAEHDVVHAEDWK